MSSRKFGLNLVVVLAIAALFTGFWALVNRPVSAPAWPEQISGFSYSPFRLGESPQKGQYPSDDEMRQDLEQMSKLTDSIRIYTVEGTQADILDYIVNRQYVEIEWPTEFWPAARCGAATSWHASSENFTISGVENTHGPPRDVQCLRSTFKVAVPFIPAFRPSMLVSMNIRARTRLD